MSIFQNLLGDTGRKAAIAAHFNGVNQNLLVASNANIVLGGGGDFEIDGWLKLFALTSGQVIFRKGESDITTEYSLRYIGGVLRFVVSNGTTVYSVNSVSFSAIESWVYFSCWFDSSTLKLNISINNGTPTQTTVTGNPYVSTNTLHFGRLMSGLSWLNGALDSVSIWKRNRTNSERTWAYNYGWGRRYIEMDLDYKSNMMARYELDETVVGTHADSHGTNHLADSGSVGYTNGIVGGGEPPVGAVFDGSNRYLQIASNSNIVLGGGGKFEIDGWSKANTLTTMGLVSKRSASSNAILEYFVRYGSSSFQFLVANGTTLTTLSVTSTSLEWIYWYAWYDSDTSTINLSINNGNPTSLAFVGTPYAGTSALNLGISTNGTQFLDGAINDVTLWKRNRTSAERTWAYNNHRGRRFHEFDAAYKTNMAAHYALDETGTGPRYDSLGISHATNVGGVTNGTGIVVGS